MKSTVLFVDDEPNITHSIERALRKEPYEIICANSAEEALELLKEHRIAVVVSDEKMPKVSGTEFLSIVRRTYPDTVRILFTGYASIESATRALNNGEVFRFLKKPCNEIDLAIAVRQALQHRKLFIRCHSLLKTVRAQREYLERYAKDLPDSMEQIRTLVKGQMEEPITLNIQQLINDLEQELTNFLEYSALDQ